MVIILQLQGNRDLSKLFWFQPTIQRWSITLRSQKCHHLTCLMMSTNMMRLVRCFNYVTPLWSAVDNYQHLSVRRKAWNTPSLVTDWNQRFDQKQQWMSVTFMTWQSVWQYAAKKRKEMASWELTEERARRSCKWWWSDNLKNSWGLETVGGFFNGLMNEGKFQYRLRLDCSWDNSWSCTKTKSVKRWAYTLKFNKN